jgi:hypothetical protein
LDSPCSDPKIRALFVWTAVAVDPGDTAPGVPSAVEVAG